MARWSASPPIATPDFCRTRFVNFLCLLGWSPKDDREVMSRQELIDAFSLEGINHSNAIVNFTEEDPFDPKAVWLNAEHIRALPLDDLAARLLPFVQAGRFRCDLAKMRQVAPLIQERIKLLRDVATVADFFFLDELPPYDPAELIPQKGDAAMALARAAGGARNSCRPPTSITTALDAALRAGARRTENQNRPDVPAHPRRRVRPQESRRRCLKRSKCSAAKPASIDIGRRP